MALHGCRGGNGFSVASLMVQRVLVKCRGVSGSGRGAARHDRRSSSYVSNLVCPPVCVPLLRALLLSLAPLRGKATVPGCLARLLPLHQRQQQLGRPLGHSQRTRLRQRRGSAQLCQARQLSSGGGGGGTDGGGRAGLPWEVPGSAAASTDLDAIIILAGDRTGHHGAAARTPPAQLGNRFTPARGTCFHARAGPQTWQQPRLCSRTTQASPS